MSNTWRAITACTPDYTDEIMRLAASCVEHGVPLSIYPYLDLGDWVLNCEHTVNIMVDALVETPTHNIVWLDADSIVKSYPFLFDDFPYDIGVYKRKNTDAYVKRHQDNSGFHYESGTIFLANNIVTNSFVLSQAIALEQYSREHKFKTATPMKLPDYPSLNHRLRESSLSIGELPVAYHCPLSNPQPEEVCDKPVIIQDMVGSSKRRK